MEKSRESKKGMRKALKNLFFKELEQDGRKITELEELVHSLMEYLALRSGFTPQPSTAFEAIRRHKSLYEKIHAGNFFSFLQEIAPHYGVRLHLVKKRPSQIQSYITENTPFLPMYWRESQGIPEVTLVTSFHSNQFKLIHLGSGHQKEEWKPWPAFAEFFGLVDKDDFMHWIVAEPLRPFSSAELPSVSKASAIRLSLQRILHLIKLEKSDIWIILIYGIGIGILSLVVPVATSSLVNIVAFGVLLQPVLVLTFLVILFLGFAGVMQVIQTYVVEILQRRIFVRVATEFASRIPKIQIEALDSHHRPELVNRFFDTMTIQKSINSLLVDGLAVVLTTIIGFILISFYHPMFLLFSLLILFVGSYFIAYRFGIRAGEGYLKISKEKYRVAAWLEEIARHNALFRSTFGSDFGLEKADSLTRDYLAAREKYFYYLIKQVIGFLGLQAVASALVLGLGGYLVITRQLTIGQLVAAELIIAKILGDLAKFNKQLESFYSLVAAVDKIGYVLSLPSNPVRLHPFEDTEKPIEVNITNVHYSLPDGHKIFDGINLNFPSGSSSAIQGFHPLEAQILMDLIAGFRQPNLGNVEYDKQDISEISEDDLNADVYVARGNEIFEGSILENLRVGRDEISLIEIREVLEALGLWNSIQAMPKGIHTHVLTFGSPLDQIQSNTILLARAILGRPRLLLVDGILDLIPDDFKEQVLRYLTKKDKPWTLVVISRSTKVLQFLDRTISPYQEPPTKTSLKTSKKAK